MSAVEVVPSITILEKAIFENIIFEDENGNEYAVSELIQSKDKELLSKIYRHYQSMTTVSDLFGKTNDAAEKIEILKRIASIMKAMEKEREEKIKLKEKLKMLEKIYADVKIQQMKSADLDTLESEILKLKEKLQE